MENVFAENIYSLVIAVLIMGILTFFSPRVLSVFPITIGYIGNYTEDNKRKAFSYSLIISIGIIFTLFILGVVSAQLPGVAKWVYLSLSIVMMREGMLMAGMVKLSPIFSTDKNESKNALLIGILGGFLSFQIIQRVFHMVLVFLASAKLLGILLFAAYVIGQSLLLLALEIVITMMQYGLSNSNIRKHNKLTRIISGVIFILIGFIASYLGFSYDYLK